MVIAMFMAVKPKLAGLLAALLYTSARFQVALLEAFLGGGRACNHFQTWGSLILLAGGYQGAVNLRLPGLVELNTWFYKACKKLSQHWNARGAAVGRAVGQGAQGRAVGGENKVWRADGTAGTGWG